MVKCSYCESGEHNISSCKEDSELVELIMCHTNQPKFTSMSEKLLRRLSAQHKIKTTLPKLQLVIQLTRKWKELNTHNNNKPFTSNDTDCAICFETLENTNTCITKCGHKYCLTCILQHSQNRTSKNNVDCPMCRTTLYKHEVFIPQSIISNRNVNENMDTRPNASDVTYIDVNHLDNVRSELETVRSELQRANENRTFIYDGNAIPYYESPISQINDSTYIDVDNYLRNNAETTNQFIQDMELVDSLFAEPPMAVELIREQYRN